MQLDLEKVDKLPFDDNFFDTVVCSEVLEHIDNLHHILKEIIRVSQYIIISMPNPWGNVWSTIINNEFYRGSLKNKEERWLKFYGLPYRKPIDRHKWFYSYSEVKRFFKKIAKENNLSILQIEGEIEDSEKFKKNLSHIIFTTFGIRVKLSGGSFNHERKRMIKDCSSGKFWIVLKKE